VYLYIYIIYIYIYVDEWRVVDNMHITVRNNLKCIYIHTHIYIYIYIYISGYYERK
jgi:hypothetical protein